MKGGRLAVASLIQDQSRVDPTRGSLVAALFRLSWPICAGSLAMVFYQILNALWLGRYDASAVAAVSMAFPFLLAFYALGDSIIFSSAALVARFTGARDHKAAGKVALHCAGLVFVYYLVACGVMFFLMDRVLILAGTPDAIRGDALIFIQIHLLCLPIMEMFFTYSNLLQATGDSMTPMKLWASGMGFSMILDPILILGLAGLPAMGVTGAAVASVTARLLLAVISIRGFSRNWRLLGLAFRPDIALIKRIIRLALPIAGERLMMSLEQMVLVSLVARFGEASLAAWGVGQRILLLAIIPGSAAGNAVNALVGQNLGADQPRRAEQASWLSAGIVFGILSLLGILLALLPGFIYQLFNADPKVLAHGIGFFRIIGPTVGFAGLFFVLGGAYRAVERTLAFMLWTLTASWILRIPLAVGLSSVWGTDGIWAAVAAANILGSVGAAAWLKFGYWGRFWKKVRASA